MLLISDPPDNILEHSLADQAEQLSECHRAPYQQDQRALTGTFHARLRCSSIWCCALCTVGLCCERIMELVILNGMRSNCALCQHLCNTLQPHRPLQVAGPQGTAQPRGPPQELPYVQVRPCATHALPSNDSALPLHAPCSCMYRNRLRKGCTLPYPALNPALHDPIATPSCCKKQCAGLRGSLAY
jgi:hypothetical protein